MNPRNLALIVILASPASAQGPRIPTTCNGPALAEHVLELLNQQPMIVAPTPCDDLTSICQSEARVEALAQSLVEEQALLQLKLRTVALARRCL